MHSRSRRAVPALLVLPLLVLSLLVLSACSGTTEPAASPQPSMTSGPASAPASQTAAPTPPPGTDTGSGSPSVGNSESATTETTTEPNLSIEISLAGGKVTPNGQKFDASVGDVLELTITSDHDDAIHIHGIDVEIPIKAGEPVTQQVTLSAPGSYEIESHHPAKTIGVLNVR
ncbi:hypothetical protein ACQCX2_07185 [Propionibacteriaceae bacterium Y1700]|uniref:hypothetical protein n=1 Tax=Microlunatus sp. Y1700 TaxID=3418487 RepID=UPI003DA73447